MRRRDKEITDSELILSLLDKGTIVRLAMVDQEGKPYIVPFNYGYDAGKIVVHSASHGRKIDILTLNPNVCFEIEHDVSIITDSISCKWSTRYQSLIGYGQVKILTDSGSKKHGLDVIMEHNGGKGPFVYDEASLSRIVILELTIESISGKQSGY